LQILQRFLDLFRISTSRQRAKGKSHSALAFLASLIELQPSGDLARRVIKRARVAAPN
jgi:hypothetical protein